MMEKLLTNLNKKYNLKLGNKSFSPIMQITIGLAMKYHDEFKRGFQRPFHFNFPDKQDSALWLSVAFMRNFLLEDYINQPIDRLEDLDINNGDRIEIFGAICIYDGSVGNKIQLRFSDQDSPIFITDKITPYINSTKKKRVNKFRLFSRKKSEARSKRNAISKLLEPKEPIIVNSKILDSKILVIAGRGNTSDFTDRLKSESLYDESLYNIFGGGENLIIKPHLEEFTFLTENDDKTKEKKFKHYLNRYKNELLLIKSEYAEAVGGILSRVEKGDYRNEEFKKGLDNLAFILDDEKFKYIVNNYFPGIKRELPRNLKSVVINDITQLETYRGVIDELLIRGIPVLVISNRYIEDKKALSLFENYFVLHPEDLRISWDKKKIRELSKLSINNKSHLDSELWKKCLKFSKQKIKIETTESHPVDNLLMDVQRVISNLENQERLRNAYWRYFNPLIYSFKNSPTHESYNKDLLNAFLSVFEEISETLTKDIRLKFDKIIHELLVNKESFKSFAKKSNLFGQYIDFSDKSLIFPSGLYNYVTDEYLDGSISEITFPGFPLNEPIHSYLLDSINEHIIEDINIVCWPKEGELTYNYILNRLKAGYYSDNIPEVWKFPDELLLKDKTAIQNEIQDTLVLDSDSQSDVDENYIEAEEEILRKISTFKYSAYQSSSSSNSNTKVSCNIIDLHGNRFMFLPKTSTVMAKIETEGDEYQIKKAKYNDLKPGDEIFQYELSRHRLRELSKDSDHRDTIFSKLELWKDSLKKSFIEEGLDLKKLLERLKRVNSKNNLGASPSYQNLRNWLFDEDMLSPEKQNLQMILYADSDTESINEFSNIYDAYKKARSLSRTVSSEIKKLIIKKLKSMNLSEKSDFDIQVFGSPMKIEFRKIKGLQKVDIEVEYQHTRKIVE